MEHDHEQRELTGANTAQLDVEGLIQQVIDGPAQRQVVTGSRFLSAASLFDGIARAGRLNTLGRSLSVDYTPLDFCPPPGLRSGRQRVEVLDSRKTLEQQRQLYGTSCMHKSEYGVELLARCPRRPQKHCSLVEALLWQTLTCALQPELSNDTPALTFIMDAVT